MSEDLTRRKETISGSAVVFLLLDISNMDEGLYEDWRKAASRGRREKAEKFHRRKDRYLSIGAAHLLDLMLREYGMREKEREPSFGKEGKPCYNGLPASFSLSHSGDCVLLTYSEEVRTIGCDLEKTGAIEERFVEFCLGRKACEAFRALHGAEAQAFFFEHWTRLESFLKADGKGFSRTPPEMDLYVPRTETLPAGLCPAGYVGAVCVQNRPLYGSVLASGKKSLM